MSDTPVALVTGAARGIGAAIAIKLAQYGHHVAVFDMLDGAETVAGIRAAGRQGIFIPGDVTKAADRAAALAQIEQTFGRLDVLVNNAGVAPKVRADILQTTEESYDRVMTINLKGPYFLTQAVANWMVRRHAVRQGSPKSPARQLSEAPAGEGGSSPESRVPSPESRIPSPESGTPSPESRPPSPDSRMCIVNISSCSAYAPSVARGEYCLSKAGVSMATKLWAARLAEHEINVYEIRPGIIATDMTAAVKEKYDKLLAEGLTPIRRWGTPADVAAAVAACASGSFPYSTGQVINVDGGFHLRIL